MHIDVSGVIAIQVPNRIYLPSTVVFMKHEGGFVLSPKGRAANVWLPLSMRFSEAVLPEDSAKIGKKVYHGTRRWLRAAIFPDLLRW